MEMNVNSELIKQLRIRKSWSQEKLADSAGLSLRTVQRVETEGVASLQSRIAISSALGIEPAELDIARETLADRTNSAKSSYRERDVKEEADFWGAYLRPAFRFGAVAFVWIGLVLSALLIFVTLISGVFFWEATPFSFWQSAGSGIIGASVFVPVFLCFYYLNRYLKSHRPAGTSVKESGLN